MMPTRPYSRPLPRGHCPGCGRDDVPLLAPVANKNGPAKGWRRKAHATAGDLGMAGTTRCRWPAALTDPEALAATSADLIGRM